MAQPPKTTTSQDAPFFSRWSKRKRLADADAPETPVVEQIDDASSEPDDSISEDELAQLPALEDLAFGTDIRPFLRKGVPQAMRNAALRKMWLLTPAIRDYKNPAVDYAWDWNTPGGVPGDGAAPSPERAAQMLRDLFAPRRDAASEEGADSDAKSAPEEDKPAPDAAVQNAPEMPVSGGTQTNVSDGSLILANIHSHDKTKGIQSGNSDVTHRRRHGGALPG